jgi:hypothetical protein
VASEVYAVGRVGRAKPTDEEVATTILDAICRWTEMFDEPPQIADWDPARARREGQSWRARRWEAGDWPSMRLVRLHFTTMSDAVRAAGLTPRRSPTRRRGHLGGPEGVLEAIREWHRRHGEPPGMADWDPARARRSGQTWRIARFYDGDWPSITTVRRHFGTLNNAILAAGLRPRKRGERAASGRTPPQTASGTAESPRLNLALRIRSVAQAQEGEDMALLEAALNDLAVAAFAWADELHAAGS